MSEPLTNRLRATIDNVIEAIRQVPGASTVFMILRVLRAGIRDIFRGELQVRAASLVYSTLLALVPLIAVSFSVLKGFGVHDQLRGFMTRLFSSVGDDQEAIVDQIVAFVDNMDVGVLGGVGLAILFYTVFSLIRKIESAINFCWRTYQGRSFGEGFTRYISIIIIGPVLLFATMTMSASIGSEPLYQQVSRIPGLASVIDWGGQLLPYGLLVLFFTAIYYFLPNTYVRLRAAFVGGVIAAFLWFLFSMLFAEIVAGSGNYVAIYATFATMIIFMLWMFLAWLLLLFGAAIAFYAQNPAFADLSIEEEESHISGQARERLSLAVMRETARQFAKGLQPPTIATLSQQLDAPIQSVSWVVDVLVHARLLTATDTSPPAYVPGRAADAIRIIDVLTTMRRAGHDADQRQTPRHPDEPVSKLMMQIERSVSDDLDGMTIADLAADGFGKNPPPEEADTQPQQG